MEGNHAENPPNMQEVEQLRAELDAKEHESKQKGLPFNRTALLRRIAQTKGRYYDSAEFVLKNGFPNSNQKPAYFSNVNAPQNAHQSRFHEPATIPESEEKEELEEQ